MTVTCHPPFALTPRQAFPEMTSVAVPCAPRFTGAVLMPLHIDDGFHDRPEICSLPDSSVSSLLLAGTWSATNSMSGFVPARVFARFSGGSALVERTLRSAGLIERVKGGGWQIAEGHGLAVENADVAARRVAVQAQGEKELDQKAQWKRAADKRRQALCRDPVLKKAIRDRDADRCRYCDIKVRWTQGRAPDTGTFDHVDPDGPNALENLVVACCSCNGAKKHRTPEGAGMKLLDPPCHVSRHVSERDVHRDPEIDDLNQGSGRGHASKSSDAREAERDGPRGLVAAVIARVQGERGLSMTGDQAEGAIAAVRDRAKERGIRIRSPKLYIPAAVANEPDLFGVIEPEAPPLKDVLASFAEVPLEGRHSYEHDSTTGACRQCDMPRSNQSRHLEAS